MNGLGAKIHRQKQKKYSKTDLLVSVFSWDLLTVKKIYTIA